VGEAVGSSRPRRRICGETSGSKGGRPRKVFSVKPLIYEPKNVQNLPSFFVNPSDTRDLSFGQGSEKSVQNLGVSKTTEGDTAHQDTLGDETSATREAVEKLCKNPPESGPEVLDILDKLEGVSKTSEAETLSSTEVLENAPEVLDTSSGIKGDPPSTEDYTDWDPEGWS